jgi:hypothetical protein
MCTKYFMIDNLLEVFHLAIDSRCHGQVLSSLSLLPKFIFIAIYHKCLRETTDLLDFVILLFYHANISFLSVLINFLSILSYRMPNDQRTSDWTKFTKSIGSYKG